MISHPLPQLSIIMPTFNSERTIRLSLESIRQQEYPQELVEILVIDGGSTDQTLAIAEEWSARVIPNPRTQQEYAKHIGLLEGQGKYAIFLDSDEVFENRHALKNRVAAFNEVFQTRVVLSGGYRKPKDASGVNDYINIFSDPFAWFIYGTTSEASTKIQSWNRKYRLSQNKQHYTSYDFSGGGDLPLVDFCAGNSLDLKWLQTTMKDELKSEMIIPRLFYLIAAKAGSVVVLKGDAIIHYSSDSYRKLVLKLHWRAIVNIHYTHIPGTGFANREEFQTASHRLRKFLFIPYAVTWVGPLLDSFVQFERTRKLAVFAHAPLAFITIALIAYNYCLKVFGIRPRLKSYGDGSKELDV